MTVEKDELEYLLDLADHIGERVAKGDLPAKNAQGFYILDAGFTSK